MVAYLVAVNFAAPGSKRATPYPSSQPTGLARAAIAAFEAMTVENAWIQWLANLRMYKRSQNGRFSNQPGGLS